MLSTTIAKLPPIIGQNQEKSFTMEVGRIERFGGTVMSQTIIRLEHKILSKLHQLAPHRQEQVLDFIEFLLSLQHRHAPSLEVTEIPLEDSESLFESAAD